MTFRWDSQRNAFKFYRRRALTLVEMLLVVTILALVGSVAGMFIYQGIAKERFHADGRLILGKMHLAREMAIQMDTEVRLKIAKEDNGISWVLESDVPLRGGAKVLTGSPKLLKGIASIAVDDKIVPFIEFVCSRMGSLRPAGKFTLYPVATPELEHKDRLIIVCDPLPHLISPKDLQENHRDAEESVFPSEVLT